MKVIDMLDRIAKGEEVKFKIIATCEVLNLTKDMHLFSITHDEPVYWFIDEEWLNYEVEVIEDKKIRKLDFIEENTFSKRQNGMTSEDRRLLDSNFRELGNKLNEIIDKINEEN